MRLPDPALVVLVGPAGSGKSTWAQERYRREEIVSSDALRGVVGSGPHDLDASDDAFDLLERVVGLPTVAVVLATPDPECRRRNAARDRPVPAAALAGQLTRAREVQERLATEAWDVVHVVQEPASSGRPERQPVATGARGPERRTSQGLRIVLQVSRFPWGEDPTAWLAGVARAADETGFAGIAVMDHLIQIPQVDRAWEPIAEPWVTLGLLAGLGTGLSLGTLVTPVTFRPPGITAKAAATLDVLSGGRAFVGVGAGWWEREHAAYGLAFPSARERFDALEEGIEMMRALWGPGTKAYAGRRVSLPETTCYPRPVGSIPVIVGGGGERRTLRTAAELGDGCNVPSDLDTLDRKVEVLHAHCREVGRDPAEVAVTVHDLPVIGRDRDDTWARVERRRGRSPAAAYARRTHAGTPAEQRDRYGALADRGVDTVFLALGDLVGPEDVLALADLTV